TRLRDGGAHHRDEHYGDHDDRGNADLEATFAARERSRTRLPRPTLRASHRAVSTKIRAGRASAEYRYAGRRALPAPGLQGSDHWPGLRRPVRGHGSPRREHGESGATHRTNRTWQSAGRRYEPTSNRPG